MLAAALAWRLPGRRDDLIDSIYSDPSTSQEPSPELPSSQTLEVDEAGEPVLARMTYVDEETCIGCKNCALVARNTFVMNDDFAGKARVFSQGGDSEDLIDEAIETCPVNCIHYVSFEDLVTLESERAMREGSLDFNNYAAFKRAWTGQDAAVPETQATYYGSLAMGNRCTNCPSRGCADCPMFGVGLNPLYLRRLERRQASGAVRRREADQRVQELIDGIYEEATGAQSAAATAATPFEESWDAIFGDYSVADLDKECGVSGLATAAEPAALRESSPDEAEERFREVIDDDVLATQNLDPYAILGVARDAPLSDIRRAFRRQAMRWHPDRCASLPELERLSAELIFKQVTLAHEVLTDEAKRRKYDAGSAELSDLVAGFWDSLVRRMQGRRRARAGDGLRSRGPVAPGSGLSLLELAKEEKEALPRLGGGSPDD